MNNKVRITVNDVEVLTLNLHVALKRLRAESIEFVWVDFLRINQHDYEERSIQIRKMGTIYKQARQVAVWLGDEEDIEDYDVTSLSAEGAKMAHRTLSVSAKRALTKLLSRSYWKRIWIIQELAAASSIIIFCGRHKLSWESFSNDSYDEFGVLVDNTGSDELETKISENLHVSNCLPLDFAYLRTSNRRIADSLPSWVVDWSDLNDFLASQEFEHILESVLPVFSTPYLHQQNQPHADENTLVACGSILGTIDGLSSTFFVGRNDSSAKVVLSPENSASLVQPDLDYSSYISKALLETPRLSAAGIEPPPSVIKLWSSTTRIKLVLVFDEYTSPTELEKLERSSDLFDEKRSLVAFKNTMEYWDTAHGLVNRVTKAGSRHIPLVCATWSER